MRSGHMATRVTLFAIAIGLVAAGAGFGGPAREAAPAQGGTSEDKGFVVTAVDPASPAEKAGVKRGDILLKADKVELASAADLGYYVSRLKVGDSVELQLLRGGASERVTAKLGERNGRPYLGVTLEGEGPGGNLGFRFGPGATAEGRLTPRGMMDSFGAMMTVEAVVEEVVEGSPAAAAGIKQGDRVLTVDGATLQGSGSLATAVAKHKPGDKVTLEVQRSSGGATEKIEVALAASAGDSAKPYLGVRYRDVPVLGQEFRGGLGMRGAAVVREVAAGSPAEQAGIRVGDLIVRVGAEEVSFAAPLADLVAKHKPGDKVDLVLYDMGGDKERTVTVTLAARSGEPEKAYLGVVTGGRMLFSAPEAMPRAQRQTPQAPNVEGRRAPTPIGI